MELELNYGKSRRQHGADADLDRLWGSMTRRNLRYKIKGGSLMYAFRKSQSGEGTRRWRFLFCVLTLAFIALICPPAKAQKIGVFTEGERYATISVPGKPGEIPSAPTVQDAVDLAKGPTIIEVSLTTSEGFLAVGKEVYVAFADTTVTTPITFVDCPRAMVERFTTTQLIAFVRCRNILVQQGETGPIMIDESTYGHIYGNTINERLSVRRSAGISISSNTFTGAVPCLRVSECNDAPTGPSALEWARYLLDLPISVENCVFTKNGAGPSLSAAALIANSRVSMQRCRFEEIEGRGIEAHDCAAISLQYNTIYKVRDAGIAIFNSEGLAQGNTIRDVALSFGPPAGINMRTVDSIGQDQPRRCNVKIEGNKISETVTGISGTNATVNITGNTVAGCRFGISVSDGCDGAIVGGLFRDIGYYGISVRSVAPGFLIQNTTMHSVNIGLLVDISKQVTIKDVEWKPIGLSPEAETTILRPVIFGGIQIVASEVTLENVRIGCEISAFALSVASESGREPSTVQCSSSSFNVQGQSGTGIYIDGSTLKGTLGSWCDKRSLLAKYKANVALSGGGLASNQSTAVTVESESSFEMTQGQLEQKGPGSVTVDQISAASDVVKVSGGSKIRLSGTGISGLGALVHLSGASEGVFENCALSGSALAAGSLSGSLLGAGNVITGTLDGLLVEDQGSLADVRNGNIYHQGQNGIRALSGGRVVANGLRINSAKTYVQVDAGGKVELDNCTLGETPGGCLTGIRVNSSGEAVVRNSSIAYFFEVGIKVASGGTCELTNCSLQNGNIGIQAEPGATLSQSGTQFRDLTTMPEPSASGGTQ